MQPLAVPVTRRTFLAGSAVALAVASPGRSALTRADPQIEAPRIGIVGAGIAGLTAALTLHDAGYVTTLYEAAERVGGRMHSNTSTWADDQTSEWCGEFIDSEHHTILELARSFGMPIVDLLADQPPNTQTTYAFLGRYYPVDEARSDFQALTAVLEEQLARIGPVTRFDSVTPDAAYFDQMSVDRWIDSYVPGGLDSPLGRLLAISATTENGRDSDEVSALGLIYALGEDPEFFGATDQRYHIGGGNQRLPEAITEYLSSTPPACGLRLGWRMTGLARTPSGGVSQ